MVYDEPWLSHRAGPKRFESYSCLLKIAASESESCCACSEADRQKVSAKALARRTARARFEVIKRLISTDSRSFRKPTRF